MSIIAETEAFVLTKIDFGDTSNIVSLFTKEFGKISAIVKGAKSGKAGKSRIIDPPNYLQIMLYNKPSRDVQLISGAEIISYYPKIKDDLEKLKYSYAVVELIRKLLPEHEPNHKIFKGIVRIFELYEISQELPEVTFGRFFLFLMKESGYEVQIDRCTSCGKTNLSGSDLSYNFDFGILCGECGSGLDSSLGIDAELFRYLVCLKNNLALPNPGKKVPGIAINFMEKYLRHHIPGFSGIQTFQIFK